MEKNNEESEKTNDNSLDITGSASLKAAGSEGNTECLCLPVLQSHFLSIWLRERHFGWLCGSCIRTNGVPFTMTLCPYAKLEGSNWGVEMKL